MCLLKGSLQRGGFRMVWVSFFAEERGDLEVLLFKDSCGRVLIGERAVWVKVEHSYFAKDRASLPKGISLDRNASWATLFERFFWQIRGHMLLWFWLRGKTRGTKHPA